METADLLKTPGRPHEGLALYKELFRIERQIKDLTDEKRLPERQERTVRLLKRFKALLDNAVRSVPPKDRLGEAVYYALKRWTALTKFAEAGHRRASKLCRALHESGGGGQKGNPLRRLRARRARRDDLLFTGRVV